MRCQIVKLVTFASNSRLNLFHHSTFVKDVTNAANKSISDFKHIDECDRVAYSKSKLRLLTGACIVNEIRRAVKEKTNYECSAGIAHNKIIAKLCCGFNKPNKQTVVPIDSVAGLFTKLEINKVKSLGGKLGEEICQKLNVKVMGDLLRFSEAQLIAQFQPRVGSWLYQMARGIDLEKVKPKFNAKSIAASKNFRGKDEINTIDKLTHWLRDLSGEVLERLNKDEEENNRLAKSLSMGFTQQIVGRKPTSSSRVLPLNGGAANSLTNLQIADLALDAIKRSSAKFLKYESGAILNNPITHLSITVTKFENKDGGDDGSGSKNLQELFTNHKKRKSEDAETPSGRNKRLSTEQKIFSPARSVKSITSTTPSPARSIEDIKQFEMKSPKPVMKAAAEMIEKITQKREEPVDVSSESQSNNLEESISFGSGDFALRGVEDLQFMLQQTVTKLDAKIQKDSLQNSRSPQCIVIKFTHANKRIPPVQAKINLNTSDNKPIDVICCLESSDLKNYISKEIEHPIKKIEIIADDFVDSKFWACEFIWKKIDKYDHMNKKKVKNVGDSSMFTKFFTPKAASATTESAEANNVQMEQDVFEVDTQVDAPSPSYSPTNSPNDISLKEISFEDDEPMTKDVKVKSTELPPEPEPSTSSNAYAKTYAEFQGPNISLEELDEKEKCTECGRMISKYEMPEHLDFHLAMAISNEQRVEFRQQKQSSQSSQVKKKPAKPSTSGIQSIGKFVVKVEPSSDEIDDSDKIKCEKCHRMIPIEEIPSHEDYHVALELQREDRPKLAKLNNSLNRSSSSSSGKSSQKTTQKSTSKAGASQYSSLKNFFKPKP